MGLAHHEENQRAEEDEGQEANQDAEEAAESAGTLVDYLYGGVLEGYSLTLQELFDVGFFAYAAGVLLAACGDYVQLLAGDLNLAYTGWLGSGIGDNSAERLGV